MTTNNKKIQLPDINQFWHNECFHGVTQTFNSEIAFWIQRGNGESEQENNRRVEMYTEARDEINDNIYSNFGNGQEVQLSKEMFREFERLEADFLNNRGIESLSDEHIELMEDPESYMLEIIDTEYMENLEWEFEKFAVSPFMAEELRKRNEPVISNILDFENIWMRQTYGQLVVSDWVIKDIYNSWVADRSAEF